ncbi:MAG TPA: DUF3786 domain-containing protein [Methanomassiliicoccales archaeon]|nr:DUF3786 domain-containing protein [Methanomassiliicoccales archaeon]
MVPDAGSGHGLQRTAIELAWKALEGRDVGKLASDSGSRRSAGHLLLPFFEDRLIVDLEGKKVLWRGKEADETSALLALHYLAGCGPDLPSGDLVPFNRAEGGDAYYGAFKRRIIDRLASEFGRDPASLIRAGLTIGGMDVAMGAAGLEVIVFPKVVLTLIVWEGDEDVPAAANVLFDAMALDMLSTEDLAVMGSLVIARLIKARNAL